jgi:regulation of enolase protein 1 (concanavalin A-like superfamily)
LDPVRWADNGASFQAFLTNALGSTQSVAVTLTVNPDTVAPEVRRVYNVGLTNVVIEFSEAVAIPAGAVSDAFRIDGGVTVRSAALGTNPALLVLEVRGLLESTRYRLTINGIRDQSARANALNSNTEREFFTTELVPVNLGGNDARATMVQWVARGGFDVSARGGDISGTADSAGFAAQSLTGNFDLRVRVDGLTVTDPYMTAGLVVRSGTEANAPFAGAFAGSASVGSFFRNRPSSGANASMTAPRDGYPVNYPQTWLRLRRDGASVSGFGSFDGTNWTALGSASLSMPSSVQVGLTVAGRDTNAVAVVRFRDYGIVSGANVVTYQPLREGLGLSSRRTRIVFSEIQYHPQTLPGSPGLEFVELYNAGDVFEDLSRWKIEGTVRFQFPEGFRLGAGQFVVVAKDPAALMERHGIRDVLGPYSGSFNGSGGPLELRDEMGAQKLATDFGNRDPWPAAADGSGHSLVLANPSYGEADPRAWSISAVRGGNPGEMDALPPVDPASKVVINEVLAHTDLPQLDTLELYNGSAQPADLSGCVLTDDVQTNRFRIPAGTVLVPGGFLVLDEKVLGFRLSAAGESVWLISSNGVRVLDVVRFGAQENGVASGRTPDGSSGWRRLESFTPGKANAVRRLEDVVLNEIMYHPISDDDADEFVELHNRSSKPVDLAGWRLAQGVSYTFPAGASIPSGGYVVVGRNVERLRANHTQLTAANSFGNWSGSLRNSGERLSLSKPDEIMSTNSVGQVSSDTIHIEVSTVDYRDAGRWGQWSGGGGSSMELVDPRADPLRASSWADSDETAKGEWQQFTLTDTLRFSTQPASRLQLGMLGAGECLLDQLEVLNAAGTLIVTNGGFEVGLGTAANGWSFLGHHRRSRIESTGAFEGSRVLRVIAPGDLDAGRNCIRAPMSGGLNDG